MNVESFTNAIANNHAPDASAKWHSSTALFSALAYATRGILMIDWCFVEVVLWD